MRTINKINNHDANRNRFFSAGDSFLENTTWKEKMAAPELNLAADVGVLGAAITLPSWAMYMGQWAGFVTVMLGLLVVIIRLVIVVRDWRNGLRLKQEDIDVA